MKSFYSFLILFCLSAASSAFAQTHTPRYVSMVSNSNAYYEYLPEGYDAKGTATYPLILFMTGIGEFGNGSATELPYVLKNGIPKLIENGTFPKSFTVNGQTHRFIVITPQFKKTDRPTADDMDAVLNYVVAHYKVDLNRIYITGLSYGGGLSFAYPGTNATYAKRIAAIVPVASPVPDGGDATIYARSRVIAANNVAVWATHNLHDQDDTVATTIAYVNYINQSPAPTPPAKKTIFDAGGHNAWDKTYNPAFKEDGLNIYEWMLQYQRNIVAPNKPPTANAGPDQNITLPANTVTLSGSATDDGGIAGYNWTKVSGPAGGNITSPAAAATTVTGLTQGTYIFRLTVADNKGATAADEVSIVVNAAANVAPKANAGTDQNITLPTNTITLNGSATDDENAITYSWAKVSGPAAGTITSPQAATTTVSGLAEGSYVFRLTATDNKGLTGTDDVNVVVNAAPNKAPQANAGTDQTITLPDNSVSLKGSAIDSDGSIVSYSWTKVSGPASGGNITTPNADATTVTGLQQGSYVFRLTVADNKGAAASDDVTVTVNAAPVPNQPPKVNAGADKTITLPENSTTLTGTVTDADGTITQYAWTKTAGPAAGNLTSPNSATTTVTGLVEGVYTFRLTATDDDGATAFDDVIITAAAAPNKAPVANAGSDLSITLPVNKADLSGTGIDEDGTIASYLWTKVSGPAGGDITTKDALKTSVTALVQGTYVYRLTVTDNKGAAASDDVTVTVNGVQNKTPAANAGADITITLPVNTATLSGSGTDADGVIASYLWTKVSGPAQGNIATKDSAKTALNNLVQGTYIFRLAVTDNMGATAFDDVTVTVLAAPVSNVPPVANAGPDQNITLPVTTATLQGSGTDSDGSIKTYSWTKVSGPAGAAITTPTAAATTVTGLVEGSYVFRLTVTDNSGDTASDEVAIVVHAAPVVNKDPQANAGADQSITLPVSTVTLSGTGTDPDGSITAYAWTQVSGPNTASFASAAKASTSVAGLVQGTYLFRLTVTDNKGATASDDVSIVVNAAPAVNQAPKANAGADQTITLPVNKVMLSGTATDADGTIATYAWTKVSGPEGANTSTPNAAATTITGLVQGTYVFRLTVTDNSGAKASDDVTVTVNAALPVNKAPQVDAGANQNITLPVDSAILKGAGTDADGSVTAYAWVQVSGPSDAKFTTPDAVTTTVKPLKQGSYLFQLTVTDNSGATASDTVRVNVTVVTAVEDDTAAAGYTLWIAPNPAQNQFTIKLLSSSAKPAYLRITDALGKTVEERTNLQRNTAITLGQNYRAGVYHAEVIQDGRKMVVKLLKL